MGEPAFPVCRLVSLMNMGTSFPCRVYFCVISVRVCVAGALHVSYFFNIKNSMLLYACAYLQKCALSWMIEHGDRSRGLWRGSSPSNAKATICKTFEGWKERGRWCDSKKKKKKCWQISNNEKWIKNIQKYIFFLTFLPQAHTQDVSTALS